MGRFASQRLCSQRFRRGGFAALLDPTSSEDLCALVTPDSLNTIAGDQRVTRLPYQLAP